MSDVVTWRADYNPLSPVGAARFALETLLGFAIMLRGTAHSLGVLQYHRDRLEWAQEHMDSDYHLWRFSVSEPAVPPGAELRIRLMLAWIITISGLMLVEFASEIGQHPVAAVIAAANWALLAADPLLFAVEHRNLW